MSEKLGRLTVCDRCGASVFSELIETESLDGDFTKLNKFEPKPSGWSHKRTRDLKIVVDSHLCPECAQQFNKMETAYMNQINHFMKKMEG